MANAKTPHAQTSVQAQIDATDKQIDQIVYELYGLTPEEIRIVEEGSASAKVESTDVAERYASSAIETSRPDGGGDLGA